MSSAELRIQQLVHTLDQGGFRKVFKTCFVGLLFVALCLIHVGVFPLVPFQFRGFKAIDAIDQAQISREIGRGRGFTTRFIRPQSIRMHEKMQIVGGDPRSFLWADTMQAPLAPIINAVATKKMETPSDYIGIVRVPRAEIMIAFVSMAFFGASILLLYLLVRRLFDRRLATIVAILVLFTDLFWRFSISGLPQLLMLFLFQAALLVWLKAAERERPEWCVLTSDASGQSASELDAEFPTDSPDQRSHLRSLLSVGVLSGLLTLTHGGMAWIFLGYFVASLVCFRSCRRMAGIALALGFFAVLLPWWARNYHVCGNPFGEASFVLMNGDGAAEFLRSLGEPSIKSFFASAPSRVMSGFVATIGNLSAQIGCPLALVFFVSLFYSFRRRGTAAFRWMIFLMWLLLVAGMGLLPHDAADTVEANQFNVILVPTMLAFSVAFLSVLFSRTPLSLGGSGFAKGTFIVVLFLFNTAPLSSRIMTFEPLGVQFPPYFPAIINQVGKLVKSDEVIYSDMPWAVSWYADRKSIWIPVKKSSMAKIKESGAIPESIVGLFMSPMTRNLPLVSEMDGSAYRDWIGLILGEKAAIDTIDFPFYHTVQLGRFYTLYTDRVRDEELKH